ncbi:polyprenyl synthetase family protein [Rhabdothermincola sediminis]|uniref:polyprenyl synthetase family protein n=1 Tax=Rhabdothermincola sediminis TaxID=2751370 RepID=UPI001AA0A9A0|nr:polyprenyl synthetase family protein [Rhabdothermincola sediminis]
MTLTFTQPPVLPSGSARPVAAPVAAPAAIRYAGARIDEHLGRFLADQYARWTALDPDLAAPLEALSDAVLAGGKRLRPAFCRLGFEAGGADPDASPGREQLDDAGAALELLHAFALIHDDVMDGSFTRRGRTTTHVRFEAQHQLLRARGESRRFGESVAILIGDLAHAWAEHLAGKLPPVVQPLWREMQAELMMGQYLDVLRTAHGRPGVAQAERIAVLKSARYTIEWPLRIGATLAEAPFPIHHALSTYGRALGLAFQLRDDLLGAFGQPDTVGKPVGADLRDGKPTPLLALALERASAHDRQVLETAGAPGLDDAAVADIQAALIRTGAVEAIEERIERLAGDAVRALAIDSLPPHAARSLTEAAAFVVHREH